MPTERFTDAQLAAALKLDSHVAFVEIFRLYYPGLVMFCSQFTDDRSACEDIVQDVFLKLWEGRHSLEIRRSLKTYLTVLVQNRALDLLRRNKIRMQYASQSHMRLLSLSPEEHMFYSELSDALDKAIDTLPEAERTALVLSFRERLTYPQIAARLGVSVRTVEVRMSKALRSIRESLRRFNYPMFVAVALSTL